MLKLQDDEFYMEKGFFVFTERYHLRRGRCCGSGCRHCPYNHLDVAIEKKASLKPPYPYFAEQS